ncbi:MAG: PQQ-binding-like beta-propeller repeat protein, partial [Candidatus Promineifilaceae bacterium]
MNRRILVFFVTAVFLVALLCQSDSTYAQSSQSTYWRYDAPDRLSHLAVGDIDGDGIDEFVIAAGGSEVVLVGADGIARWSIPYRTDSTIYDMAITNLQDEIDHTRQIILLIDSGITALDGNRKELFNIHFDQEPSQLHSVKLDADAADAVVVAFENGDLELYDGSGEQLWELSFADANIGSAQPLLAADDLDRDGIEEIVYTYFTDEGFSKVVLLSGAGDRIWERSNSGNITAIAIVEFDPERPKEIALATSLNRVFLHSADGSRRWTYRSPNKPITALEPAILDGTPVLLVGTSVGKTIAYDDLGRRVWEETYSATADRPVQSISVSPAVLEEKSPVALSILLGPSAGSTEAADLIVTDANGRRLEPTFPVIDSAALSRLTDVNQDGLAEVLLAGFATAELLDPGVGVRHYSGAWDYRLDAGPQAFAIVDLDRDNEQEVLIGTDDGTVHALKNDGTRMWTAELGGIVSNILVAYPDVNSNPYAAVIHNDSKINDRGVVELEGWLELLNYDGRQLWSRSQPSNITAMVVGDINRSGPPEIIVGTSDGLIIAYSLTGDEFWRSTVSASVDTLTLSTDPQGVQIIAGTGANKIDRIDNKGVGFEKTAEYLDDIVDIELLTRDPQIVPMLIAAVEDGTVRGLTTKGNQIWEVSLPGTPLVMYPADDAVLVGTDDEQLVMVDIDGEIVWRQLDAGIPTSLYWGDLNGDITADVAVGNRQGDIRFITADGAETWDELNLDSAVVAISAIGVPPESQADLVAVTDNGIVQLFKSSANRPPLLINPRTEVSEGSYNVSVSVIDVEGDPVHVILELYDPDGEQWVPQGEKTAVGGFSTLFWSVDAPVDAAEIRYRYQYDDGSHSAVIEPAAGPPAIPASPILLNALAVAFLAVVGAGGTYLYFRQARSPENRARKLYGRIKNNPSETLSLINEAFNQTGG